MIFLTFPAFPVVTFVLLLVFALYSFLFRKNFRLTNASFLVGYLVLGLFAQILNFNHQSIVRFGQPDNPVLGSKNLVDLRDISDIRGFWRGRAVSEFSRVGTDGFWTLKRDGINEITSGYRLEIQPGVTYTQSFFFQTPGLKTPEIDLFKITFFTNNGHHFTTTKVMDLGNGFKRAYATFTASDSDHWLRVLNLLELKGNWTEMKIGFPQVEASPQLSPYSRSALSANQFMGIVSWLIYSSVLLAATQVIGFYAKTMKSERLVLWVVLGGLIYLALHYFKFFGDENANFVAINLYLGCIFVSYTLKSLRFQMINLALILIISVVFQNRSGALLALVYALYGLKLNQRIKLAGVFALLVFIVFKFQTISTYLFDPERIEIYWVALRSLLENPISGVGFNNFSGFFMENLPERSIIHFAGHAHNLFLSLAAEMGLLGICSICCLIFFAFSFQGHRVKRASLPFVLTLTLSTFDYFWFYFPTTFLLALIMTRDSPNHQGVVKV
jgi:hypothetical protein